MSLRDNSGNTISGLTMIGIDFITGNDAPRGGKEGYYIMLTHKGQIQVREYASTVQLRIEARKTEEAKTVHNPIILSTESGSFESNWHNSELKEISGLSWRQYREHLKESDPEGWKALTAKFINGN